MYHLSHILPALAIASLIYFWFSGIAMVVNQAIGG